jgi:uncharacterized protein (TIGR02266 family)
MGFEDTSQRQSPRLHTRLFGVFRRDIDIDETEVMMLNLSVGGAFIRTEEPCPPGSTITLRFYLDESSVPLSVTGEVVWLRRPGQNGGDPGMGVKFHVITDDAQRQLREYLARMVEDDLFG